MIALMLQCDDKFFIEHKEGKKITFYFKQYASDATTTIPQKDFISNKTEHALEMS